MDNLETTLEGYIKYKLSEFREQFFQECDIITYYGGITG